VASRQSARAEPDTLKDAMQRVALWLVLSAAAVLVAAAGQTSAPEASCYACLSYYHDPEGKTNLIEDIGLDREEGDRTILLNTAAYNQLYLVIFYTYSTASEVLVRLTCSTDAVAFKPHSAEKLDTEGRNQRYLLSYDVSGCKTTKVVFSGSTDANSADVITVQAVGQATNAQKETLPVQ
jgi:hypothetical protein